MGNSTRVRKADSSVDAWAILCLIVLFIVASFLCGTSSSLGELVFFRLLQGAGGAALLSTAQATLR